MPPDTQPLHIQEALAERLRDLQARLDEAEETLRALRSGEVDAIVAVGPEGDRVYTLKGADETYRVMVQEMSEGALTVTLDGLILFSNKQFGSMIRSPLERVIGHRILDFVAPEDTQLVSHLLSRTGGRKAEVRLSPDGATFVPVYLSVQNVILDGVECYCVIVTDLSAQKRYEEIVAVMEAVPVGVFITHDAECRRMVGNRMAYELLRLPAGASGTGAAGGRAPASGPAHAGGGAVGAASSRSGEQRQVGASRLLGPSGADSGPSPATTLQEGRSTTTREPTR